MHRVGRRQGKISDVDIRQSARLARRERVRAQAVNHLSNIRARLAELLLL